MKSSSNRPRFHKVMRRLSVLEIDPFVSDLFLRAADVGESLLLSLRRSNLVFLLLMTTAAVSVIL